MRYPSSPLVGVFAAVSLWLTACGREPISPPDTARAASGDWILTSFDRVTLAPRERARFRAALVNSGRLSSAGLDFVVRNSAVANLSAADGRAQVLGVAAGRTWVVVRSAVAPADSVEVIVE